MQVSPPIGAHLVSPRSGYFHHGIHAGDGRVIHYAGFANRREAGPVEETDLEAFANGNGYQIAVHKRADPPPEIIKRARSRLTEAQYSLFANNCEHFCNWCVTGDHTSTQIDLATAPAVVSIASAAGVAARAIVAASGPVVGLSGAGVMSGLASVGTLVGGGAVAGLAILGASPALATASLMNSTVLADTPAVNQQERKVRKIGRLASYGGAIAGTAGSIAAVSTFGTTAGLSAAGITSGLSAIGGVVGLGMGAGVAIATTAPVLVAAAVGYSAYKAAKGVAHQVRSSAK